MYWATEILDKDMIWKSGYDLENNDTRPNINYGPFASSGGQSYVTNEKYSGSSSLKVSNTVDRGNFYLLPALSAPAKDSVNRFESFYGLKNEIPLTINYRAKSDNDNSFARFWA